MINDKEFEIEVDNNVVKSNIKNPIELKFHSQMEETLVRDIMKIDMDAANKELDKRIIVQHTDRRVNIDCFNAFSKNVLIRDENGKRIIINNHVEIKLHKIKNSIKDNKKENIQPIVKNDIDNDIDFD